MRKLVGLIVLLMLASAPVLAQKIHIDYAHDFDFEKVKTFQYVDTEETNVGNPLMADRVKQKIIEAMVKGGGELVQENPDIYITYHFTSEDQTQYNTTHYGYGGYHGGWYGWGGGMGSSTTRAYTYTTGTLVIDAYDAMEKKMVWRGSGTVTVKEKPEKQIKQIDNILKKMGKRWDKILKNKGK